MENLDSLTAVAEVGAALAGFATLAGILRRDYVDRNIAFGVVETSLIAVAFSLLPPTVGNLRVTAALFFLVWTTAWVHATYRQRKFGGSMLSGLPLIAMTMLALPLAGSAFALLVALGMYSEHATRFYASAVLCPLLVACFLLWLTVRRIVFPTDGPPPA